jgi:oligopeptide/dipeptide ABC transporter ATP-binding protein
MSTTPLLEVADLEVSFRSEDGRVTAVQGVNFTLDEGETLGLVGESGSGKTVTSMSILGLLPDTAEASGSIKFRGEDLLSASEHQLRELRGDKIAMVFQDALTALNPVYTVGAQIAEMIETHRDVSKSEVRNRVIELLDVVGIPNPRARADTYPHEFSGGMRQRAMIAMAIANEPELLIADEPTTALDVTVQAQVLEVLGRIQDRTGTAILLITHDLGVVAGVADRVMVMYAGREVELASVDELFDDPRHPYTRGLLASLPRHDRARGGAEQLHRIEGSPPSLLNLPPGCAFWPRCPDAERGLCDSERPAHVDLGPGHTAACLRLDDLAAWTGPSHGEGSDE